MQFNNNQPLISVIIVNYNGQRFLEKCFMSLKAQTYPNVEMICVDNGSQDNSLVFMRQYFPDVRLIASTNRGFGVGCNVGVEQARGEYVFFLNEDMYIAPHFIQELFEGYRILQKKDEKIGAVACSQDGYEGQKRMDIYPGKLDLFGYPGPVTPRSQQGACIPGCPFFMRRDLFLKSGGFCEFFFLYGDDTDLSWRLILMGYHNYALPHLRLYHYDGASMPGFPPKKIYYFIYATFIGIYNNYSNWAMPVFLFLSTLYALTAILGGLLIFTKGNIQYAEAVLKAVTDFYSRLGVFQEFRKKVQKQRVISDLEFIRDYVQLRPSFLATRAYRRL